MPRKVQKCSYVCLRRAEKKLMKWFARQSPPAEPPIMNHKTTVLCTDMDFRTSIATFGNYSIWNQAPYTKRKQTDPALVRSPSCMENWTGKSWMVQVISGQ